MMRLRNMREKPPFRLVRVANANVMSIVGPSFRPDAVRAVCKPIGPRIGTYQPDFNAC